MFSDEYFVITGRQIGIAGTEQQADLLRALAAYLSSDFAIYHQFLSSPEWGVTLGRATLDALKRLPVPFGNDDAVTELAELQRRLSVAGKSAEGDLRSELNTRVFALLQVEQRDQVLVTDLVNLKMLARSGNVAAEHVRPPKREELEGYADALQTTLDGFLDQGVHSVEILPSNGTAIVRIALAHKSAPRRVVESISGELADRVRQVESVLRSEHQQWLYFDRNLVLTTDEETYLLKPMQRIWWTESQAVADAHEAVAGAFSEVVG